MNALAASGGVSKGGMMVILKQYVATAKPDDVKARLDDWKQAREALATVARNLELASGQLPKAFEETSLTTEAATRAFREAADKLNTKVDQLDAAMKALTTAQDATKSAKDAHDQLEGNLPTNHGARPDASDSQYAQSGTGVDAATAKSNANQLKSDQAAWAAEEAKIAAAEAAAAKLIQQIDESNYSAQPPVREITDAPDPDGPNKAPSAPSSPGSYSQIAASKARMEKYNSGTLYPEGWGHELIAQEKANIAGYEAENKPEWNGTQWINADGTPAPSTSYAMVETADGLAPMAGGSGGMTALAIGGGGALLGAGVAKALASKFAAGAKAATPGATSKSAAARAAGAKAGAAGARAGTGAGARGAGARGAGAGARGAGARGGRGATGAGSRGGRGGAGAGGRGRKDDKRGSQDQDWQADYTDDWTETASDVLDPGTARGWTPNAPQDDASGADKNGRRP
ncbi:hypothetical protein ABTZ46_14410 [Nocardioides sp. NPDC126508]